MGSEDLKRKYEFVLIVDAKLTPEDKEAICKEVVALIEQHGGKIINRQVWIEKQKLSFEIQKCQEGTYYLINLEAEAKLLETIDPLMKLNEKVLRYMATKVDERIKENVKESVKETVKEPAA